MEVLWRIWSNEMTGSMSPTKMYHKVWWYPENHLLYIHFVDKKPEAQSLKALPQSKKPLHDRTNLPAFIILVQGPWSWHLVCPWDKHRVFRNTNIMIYKKYTVLFSLFWQYVLSINNISNNYFLLLKTYMCFLGGEKTNN